MVRIILLFLVWAISADAAIIDSLPVKRTTLIPIKLNATLSSEFFINSNALNTKIISRFYFGNNLPLDLRQNISNHALDMNRAGFWFTNSVKLWRYGDQTEWTFSFQDKMFSDIKFTDDLYDLVFLGNKKFEGKVADLSGCGFRYWRYEQLKGSAKFKRKSGNWEAGLSILSAHNYFSLTTDESSLFTDTFGIALDLKADAQLRKPDPRSSKAFSRGTGAAIDLGYSRNIKRINSKLSIRLEDLGFVQFNKKAVTQKVDTTIHYEGFELERLFPFSDSISPSLSSDSLKQKFAHSDTSKFTAMIPAYACIELSQEKGNWEYIEKLVVRPFTYALPELKFEAIHYIKNFYFSIKGQIGGYGYAGAGFGAGFTVKGFNADLDASHIEGLILPQLTSGILIGIRLHKWF